MPEVHVGAMSIQRNHSALPVELLAAIRSVRVVKEINVPSMFEFTLNMMSTKGAWQTAHLDAFNPSDKITVKLGLDRLRELVSGRITAIEPHFGDHSTVTVRGFDAMYDLRFGTHTRNFEKKNEHGIVEEVARLAKLTVSTKGPPGAVYPHVTQFNESNYEFLLKRCAQCNCELTMDGTTLVFRPSAQGDAPVKTLNYPRDVKELNLALRVPTLGASVKAVGYDIATDRAVEVEVSKATPRERMGGSETGYDSAKQFPSSAIVLERLDTSSRQALEEMAKAKFERYQSSFIEGSARLVGDPDVTAGVNVRLGGLSKRFDGIYYVTASTHSYENSVYSVEINLRRSGI